MTGKMIYVCHVSTGEYSDRNEWPLHAYRTEKEAQEFVLRSEQLFRELWAQVESKDGRLNDYERREELFKSGWHPDCPSLDEPDYTGFRFWYSPVELRDSTASP